MQPFWEGSTDLNCSIRNQSFSETEMMSFIEHRPTIKFTADISDTEKKFLDTKHLHWWKVQEELDVRTHFNPTEHFNTRTSSRATHQESKTVSSTARLRDFSEQTLLKIYLRSPSKILKSHRRANESCLSLHKWPPSSDKLQTTEWNDNPAVTSFKQLNPHEWLAFNRTTTMAQRNLQKPAPRMLQKRAVNQRYTRKTERLKHVLVSM